MENPVLHTRCGKLFDEKNLTRLSSCPRDSRLIVERDIVPFKELKDEIEKWKVQSLNRSWAQMAVRDPVPIARTSPLIAKARNVHEDDIHCLARVSQNLFASGSKDCTVKIWDHKAQFKKELGSERAGRGYASWITAIEVFKNGSWAYGRRDGQISIQNADHERVHSFQYSPFNRNYQCKDRNKLRINCLRENVNEDDEIQIYIGTATKVQLWSIDRQEVVKSYFVSKNDWVYDVQIIDSDHILVVIGSNLELWDTSFEPQDRTFIIKETPQERRQSQRPHISSLAKLSPYNSVFTAALFDGTVRVVDVETRQQTRIYTEHRRQNVQVNRVWKVIELAPHVFASSADDANVKLWDVRQDRSFKTLGGNLGRVSNLLKLSDESFVSASCPDNLRTSQEKASFSFWDLRMLLPS